MADGSVCRACPAFAECTAIYHGDACAAMRSSYELDNNPEPITNADLIRAMSDEELAEYFTEKFLYPVPKEMREDKVVVQEVYETTLDWLKSKAEVG